MWLLVPPASARGSPLPLPLLSPNSRCAARLPCASPAVLRTKVLTFKEAGVEVVEGAPEGMEVDA